MIVICINDNWKYTYYDGTPAAPNYKLPSPKKDELVEVIQSIFTLGKYYFRLKEYHSNYLYDADHFREVDINIEDIEHKEVLEEVI